MPEVLPPDIHETDPHPGKPRLSGPNHLVHKLEVAEVEPFDGLAEGWTGEGALVLSLWTERHKQAPIRFVLSPDAGETLIESLRSALDKAG